MSACYSIYLNTSTTQMNFMTFISLLQNEKTLVSQAGGEQVVGIIHMIFLSKLPPFNRYQYQFSKVNWHLNFILEFGENIFKKIIRMKLIPFS